MASCWWPLKLIPTFVIGSLFTKPLHACTAVTKHTLNNSHWVCVTWEVCSRPFNSTCRHDRKQGENLLLKHTKAIQTRHLDNLHNSVILRTATFLNSKEHREFSLRQLSLLVVIQWETSFNCRRMFKIVLSYYFEFIWYIIFSHTVYRVTCKFTSYRYAGSLFIHTSLVLVSPRKCVDENFRSGMPGLSLTMTGSIIMMTRRMMIMKS